MNQNKEHLKQIITANNENRLAIFIGAGVSKSAVSKDKQKSLPSWGDLINDLKKELKTKENDYLKIAQMYYLKAGKKRYANKIINYFTDEFEPSIIHKLIFDLNPQVVITTNWDNLLEKTIEQNGYVYDVIASDKELINSTVNKKLIKMHGDFLHSNFVFKEDDYLNYSRDFPLIENYLKSILSTHTVLFLGYSYNDVNLKQIVNWLKNNAKVFLPRYAIYFKSNQSEQKYLKHHGINTIVLNNDIHQKYDSLVDDYSKKTATFLDLLLNTARLVNLNDDNAIIDYIYNKIKLLSKLNYILFNQIIRALGNCKVDYIENGSAILVFYTNDILTGDYNKETRAIHKQFLDILDKNLQFHKENEKLDTIFRCITKTGISGICTQELWNSYQYIRTGYEITDEITKNSFNFENEFYYEETNDIDNLMTVAYQHYLVEDYKNSFEVLTKIIYLCVNQQDYIRLFIVLFNKNNMLYLLKRFGNHEEYNNVQEENLSERFNNLPRQLQEVVEPIYRFINHDYIYRLSFEITQELQEKEATQKSNRSIILVAEKEKHKNFLFFVLNNRIMLEHYGEYQKVNKDFLKIALLGENKEQPIVLNQVELYICIKYCKEKEFKEYFSDFIKIEKRKVLNISEENKKWLLNDVLPNLINRKIHDVLFSKRDKFLCNTLFLLSLIELNSEETTELFTTLLTVIKKQNNTIPFYEKLNDFICRQYFVLHNPLDERQLLYLVEILITKVVDSIIAGYSSRDFNAIITYNSLKNVYDVIKHKNIAFSKITTIDDFLFKIDNICNEWKIEIYNSDFLINICFISNLEIKNKIVNYIFNSNYSDNFELQFRLVILKLYFVLNSFVLYDEKIENELISQLNNLKTQPKQVDLNKSMFFKNALDRLIKQIPDNFIFLKEKLNELLIILANINNININININIENFKFD